MTCSATWLVLAGEPAAALLALQPLSALAAATGLQYGLQTRTRLLTSCRFDDVCVFVFAETAMEKVLWLVYE